MVGDFTQAPEFSIVACETQLELPDAPYGSVTSGRLTVQGTLIPVLHSILSDVFRECWKLILRPDKIESAAVLTKIMEGKRDGWVLRVSDPSVMSSSKPEDYNWTETAPKGLLIVAEGEYYRRIGLCSIEPREDNTSKFRDIRDRVDVLKSYSVERRIIII